jgi:predicted phosphodiesterase
MRTAVLSDIHGNLPALEAVVADAQSRGCTRFVNLGDILSGPLWPRETADYLMARDWITIAGNHERQLLNDPPERIGPSDRYAREALDQRHLEWLRSLPATWELSADVFLCHGTPQSDLVYFLEEVENGGTRAATRDEARERAGGRGERLIRYCPICDGYEVTDRKVGVIGSDSHGVAEALFLRSYTTDLTLIAPDKALRLKPEDNKALKDAGIECVDGPAQAVAVSSDCIVIETADGTYTFDCVYPALGSDVHCQLAEQVGARLSADHCIVVDRHMRTSVPGLYAAGDVVIGLDQISHAMGQGGVAATTIRNDLEKQRPLWR